GKMRGVDLSSQRLVMRPLGPDDFAWVHPMAADPIVTRYTTWGPNDVARTRQFLTHATRDGRGPDKYLWAVTLTDGPGVGTAGLEIPSNLNRRAEFGYNIVPDHWGQGYATEAARAIVRFAFEVRGIHRLEATCHPDNLASARVLENAGLTREGR